MKCTPNVRQKSKHLEVHFIMSKYSFEEKLEAILIRNKANTIKSMDSLV